MKYTDKQIEEIKNFINPLVELNFMSKEDSIELGAERLAEINPSIGYAGWLPIVKAYNNN